MAVYKNAIVKFAGSDLSTYVRQVAFVHEAEENDDTVMGDDTRSSEGGLAVWSLEGTMTQAFGTGDKPDATFATRVGKTDTVTFWPDATSTGTLSESTPRYSGTGLLTSYTPQANESVGDRQECSYSIVAAGSLTRTIST